MRWIRIARKDVRDAVRARTMFFAAGLFVLVGGIQGYLGGGTGPSSVVPVGTLLPAATLGVLRFLVPLVALGLTYEAVAGPRTDGSMQFLLGLPYSRRDVFVGTYAGRVCVVGLAVLAGFIALAIGAVLQGVVLAPRAALLSLALAALLGVVFVAIGVGLSAAVRSTRAAGALAIVAFFLFFFLWSSVPELLAYVLNGFAFPETLPAWAPAVRTLNPLASFRVLAGALLPAAPPGGLGGPAVDSAPIAGLVVLGWSVLLPLAGYLRFRTTDL